MKKSTTYEDYLKCYPTTEQSLTRFLTRLRRAIAKDGPHQRPPGALEAFDKACNELGVPFLEP